MFCSVQEAWPEYYNYKNRDKNNNNKVVESTFGDNYNKTNDITSIGINPFINKKNIIEKFDENIETKEYFDEDCETIIKHLQYCNKCRNKLNLMSQTSIINKLNNLTEESKETIIIFLIGFIMILLIHLFHK